MNGREALGVAEITENRPVERKKPRTKLEGILMFEKSESWETKSELSQKLRKADSRKEDVVFSDGYYKERNARDNKEEVTDDLDEHFAGGVWDKQ